MNSHILVSVHDWKPDKFIEVFLYCTPSACHQQPACADKTMCYIIACPPFPYRPTLTDRCHAVWVFLRNLGGNLYCIMQSIFVVVVFLLFTDKEKYNAIKMQIKMVMSLFPGVVALAPPSYHLSASVCLSCPFCLFHSETDPLGYGDVLAH